MKNAVDVGLWNTPLSPFYQVRDARGMLFYSSNEMIRNISKNRNITFYDYDNDLWDSVNYNYSLQPLLFYDKVMLLVKQQEKI